MVRRIYTDQKNSYTRKMMWGCFLSSSVGPTHLITEIMTADIYINILEEIMLPNIEDNMPLLWTFWHDNDANHITSKVKRWS